jgi:hypothetical protein
MMMQHLFLAALLAQSGGFIETDHPSPPSREQISISAECEGRKIAIRYTLAVPGPDLFDTIVVDGKPLSKVSMRTLNDTIAGDTLDEVDLVSCDGEGEKYEVRFHVVVGSGPEKRRLYLRIRDGRLSQT